jgi:hypothetical protein
MTALAMIIGMIPMALGIGEGAEQNAPLGRAVIGGPAVRDGVDAVLRAGAVRRRASAPRAPAWRPCCGIDGRARTVRRGRPGDLIA